MRSKEGGAWNKLLSCGTIAITRFCYCAERAEVKGFSFYNTALGVGAKISRPRVKVFRKRGELPVADDHQGENGRGTQGVKWARNGSKRIPKLLEIEIILKMWGYLDNTVNASPFNVRNFDLGDGLSRFPLHHIPLATGQPLCVTTR